MIPGILRMRYSQLVAWNFVVGAVYVLSVGPAAYGEGKVSAGEQGRGQPERALTSGWAGNRGQAEVRRS